MGPQVLLFTISLLPPSSSQAPSTAPPVHRRGSKPRPLTSHSYALRSLSTNNLVSETMASSGAPAGAAAAAVPSTGATTPSSSVPLATPGALPPPPAPPTLEDSLAALASMQRQMAEMSLRLATAESRPGPSSPPRRSYNMACQGMGASRRQSRSSQRSCPHHHCRDPRRSFRRPRLLQSPLRHSRLGCRFSRFRFRHHRHRFRRCPPS